MEEIKIPGPGKSYCGMLDSHLQAEEERADSKYYPLRPSASGYCARKLAYDLTAFEGKIEKPKDLKRPSVVRLLNLGHSIEYHALSLFKKIPDLNVKFQQQTVTIFQLDSGKLIEGSIDAAFVTPDHKGLVDVKSVGDGWDQAFKSRWDRMLDKYRELAVEFDTNSFYVDDVPSFLEKVGEDAIVANITQLNLYLCSDFIVERGYDHGVIYRYNKNNSTHMEIRFKPSPELKEWVRERFNRIERAASLGRPEEVQREFTIGSQACAFCPWASKCWPEVADTKKAHFKTLPPKRWAKKVADVPELQLPLSELVSLRRVKQQEKVLTDKVINLMLEREIFKIKADNGTVYELKFLKTPKPHYELKESKE